MNQGDNPNLFKDGQVVLHLENVRFLLAKDSYLSLSEALRELAEYLETPSAKLPIDSKQKPNIWEDFCDVVKEGGRLTAIAGLNQWKIDKWHKLDLGIAKSKGSENT